ncbi:Gfo/Idh/MocA family protein [Paenibacillus agricola]|uniref:Gfo/Idh/MocA family oxidoreductase n=1 Tax=Paenibacillus agricola TaxID=2716264 RepID=A0ABX0J312_9BACL|nr:Gfo/Idh/MocA family oxidoreductase [Paenibacillus agricola]NHN30216.1 Gfo/Idh/MocA family oxidoreductase [Paenibacillus agricola]
MIKHRIVIAGCGNMSKAWIAYAINREDCIITALVDVRLEAAAAMKTTYKLDCPVFTDITEAIRATDANLVFDITISESHYAVSTAAFAEGCHVFGEKPMAASMEEARAMIAAAEAADRTYAIMQNRRYTKEMMAFRDLVQSGGIGEAGFITADFFLALHNGKFRETMDNPLLLDMAIHTFDQSRFITGKDPVSVYCHEFNPAGAFYKGNAAAICLFEYEDGSVFSYRGYYNAEGAATSWESSWRVVGSEGTAIWDGRTAPYAEKAAAESDPAAFVYQHERLVADLTWTGKERHDGCLDDMFAALNEGRAPSTVCTDNIKSVAMAYGAVQSAKEGRKIML